MGLVDSTLGGAQSGMADELMGMLGGGHGGGLPKLLLSFEGSGLGEIAQSWVSKGRNLPVSADQITQVMGPGAIGQLAQRFGVAPEQAASQIAQLLPQIVDTLTPNGSVPDSEALQEGLSVLRSKLGL